MRVNLIVGASIGLLLFPLGVWAAFDQVPTSLTERLLEVVPSKDLARLAQTSKRNHALAKKALDERTVDIVEVEKEIHQHLPEYLALASIYMAVNSKNENVKIEREFFEKEKVREAARNLARIYGGHLISSATSETDQTNLRVATVGEADSEVEIRQIPQFRNFDILRAILNREQMDLVKHSMLNGAACAAVSYLSKPEPEIVPDQTNIYAQVRSYTTHWAKNMLTGMILNSTWHNVDQASLSKAKLQDPRDAFVEVVYGMAGKAIIDQGGDIAHQIGNYFMKGTNYDFDVLVQEIDRLHREGETEDGLRAKHRTTLSNQTGAVTIYVTGKEPIKNKIFTQLKIMCDSKAQALNVRKEGISHSQNRPVVVDRIGSSLMPSRPLSGSANIAE